MSHNEALYMSSESIAPDRRALTVAREVLSQAGILTHVTICQFSARHTPEPIHSSQSKLAIPTPEEVAMLGGGEDTGIEPKIKVGLTLSDVESSLKEFIMEAIRRADGQKPQIQWATNDSISSFAEKNSLSKVNDRIIRITTGRPVEYDGPEPSIGFYL